MGHIREIVRIQRELVGMAGKPKRPLLPPPDTSELRRTLEDSYRSRLRDAIRIPGKESRQEEIDLTVAEATKTLKERFAEQEIFIGRILHDIDRDELRNMIL